MNINRFPFKYKRWYWFLVLLVNTGIPGPLAFLAIKSSTSIMHYVSLGVLGIFMVFLLTYVYFIFREYRACRGVFKNSYLYFDRFYKGIVCTFVSWNLSLAISLCALKWGSSNGTAITAVSATLSSLTTISGIVSNVYLSLFEFKLGFEVFYRKYKDTLFKDIVSSIRDRKKENERYRREGYSGRPNY